jgi:hypothetical protein
MKLKDLLESYHFTIQQTKQLWRELNKVAFDGELKEPPIYLESDLNHLVPPDYGDKFGSGDCLGYCDEDPETKEIVLLISTKIESARELMMVLAHEMVHQALAEKHSYYEMLKIGHGEEFMSYAPKIKRYHDLKLVGPNYHLE